MKTPELFDFLQLMYARHASRNRLDEMRLRKLQSLIRHAAAKVPYYRGRFSEAGVKPDDIRGLDDLRRLPVSNKADFRAAGEARLQEGFRESKGLILRHTSGYSGEPFEVYLTPQEDQRRRLRDFRALLHVGYRPWDRLVVLGPERGRPRRFHHRAGLYGLEVISGTLSPQEQIRRLGAARPSILWAYPAVLWGVYHSVGRRLRELVRPKLLLTSAQVFREPWSDVLVAELDCKHGQLYGAIEVGRIAGACPLLNGLHVEEDALILEILDGDHPAPPGVLGRAVITTLEQRMMPLIRYDIGDLVMARAGPCRCGRATMLIEPPVGRNADLVTLPSGQQLASSVLNFVLRGQTWIRQYRFTQTSRSRIILELSACEPSGTERLAELQQKLQAAMPEPVEFEVRLTAEIPGNAMKFKCFVSVL